MLACITWSILTGRNCFLALIPTGKRILFAPTATKQPGKVFHDILLRPRQENRFSSHTQSRQGEVIEPALHMSGWLCQGLLGLPLGHA